MEDFDTGKALTGFLSSFGGILTIAVYTRINGVCRKRGIRSHWGVGLVLGTLGMALVLGGWALLCLARPAVSLGVVHIAGIAISLAAGSFYSVGAWRVGRWRRPSKYSFDLKTDGIYARIRHPQALALCVMPIGLGLMSGSIPFLVTLPLWVGFWAAYTYLEEVNELIPAYGEKYLRYREMTPRLIPRLFSPVRREAPAALPRLWEAPLKAKQKAAGRLRPSVPEATEIAVPENSSTRG
jgi:protein-S-isoprenylcysteine O-methyltransferase Ste14